MNLKFKQKLGTPNTFFQKVFPKFCIFHDTNLFIWQTQQFILIKMGGSDKTPKNIQKILQKLKKDEHQLGEFCLKNAVDALKANGYTDAHIWVPTILPNVLGEMEYVESNTDLEEWILELEGMERDVVESIYDTFTYLKENAKGAKEKDIKEALVYSLSRTLETADKEKYKRLYG